MGNRYTNEMCAKVKGVLVDEREVASFVTRAAHTELIAPQISDRNQS